MSTSIVPPTLIARCYSVALGTENSALVLQSTDYQAIAAEGNKLLLVLQMSQYEAVAPEVTKCYWCYRQLNMKLQHQKVKNCYWCYFGLYSELCGQDQIPYLERPPPKLFQTLLDVEMSWGKNSKKKPMIVNKFCFLVNFIRPTGPMVTLVTRQKGRLSQVLMVEMSGGKTFELGKKIQFSPLVG